MIAEVRKLVEIIGLEIKATWAYRFDMLMWTIVQPLLLAISYFIWKAVFMASGKEVIAGFSFAGIVTYYTFNLILQTISATNVDVNIAEKVERGLLEIWMLQPMRTFYFKMLSDSSHIVWSALTQTPWILITGYFFLGAEGAGIGTILAFAIMALLAFILNYTISFLFGLLSFWLKRYHGFRLIKIGIIAFFSGTLIPLTFFPGALGKILSFSPFSYMRFMILNFFVKDLGFVAGLQIMIVQLIWIALFSLACLGGWSLALRKYGGEGG